jgi:homotetrameric cytidine deaminase
VVDDDEALRHRADDIASVRLAASARNIELKARDPQPSRTLELALGLGAEDRGEIAQRDTYFAGARGRLKLREQEPGDDELIHYRRADVDEARESDYRRVPVTEAATLREALDEAYGTLVVIDKRRRLLLSDNVRIHLDEVEGLGSFVELEGVLGPGADPRAERKTVERLRAQLEIGELEARSYSDLMLDAADLLLRAADAAMRHAHAPYSKFKVGAALRAPSGAVYTGANVENSSYPQGQCAETSAIGALVAAGESEIAAVAVVAEKLEICPPCGGCRQRLSELAGPDVPVHLGRPGGEHQTFTVAELLPLAFELNT